LLLLLIITRYSSAAGLAAVKVACIETSVIVPNVKAVAGAVGLMQGAVAVAVTVILSMLIFGLDPFVPPVPL
jgi:hypothetical protein